MERKILSLFAFEHKLKFNEIEKSLNLRSNKLAYHLKNLLKKGLIKKNNEEYKLSNKTEYLIPYLSEKNSVLCVLLVHIGNKENCFLHKRNKRPFKDLLSLPGGRILTGENISKATTRLIKEKFSINAKLKKINSISLEHLKKKNKILYSYLLIFVSATTKDKIKLTKIKENKSKIITSDYKLLENDLDKEIKINQINTFKI